MTGKNGSDRSTVAPDVALVYLSGRRRGKTEFISLDRLHLSSASDGQIEVSTGDETPPRSLAVLERRGQTYQLTTAPGSEVWINGERLEKLVLASGDVIELGGSTVLRFRLYPPEQNRYKTMSEAFSDCIECARFDAHSPIRRAGVFASRIPAEIMTQTAPRVRLFMVALVIVAVGIATSALVRSTRVEQSLHTEVARFDGLTQLLDRPDNRALTAADLEAIRTDIADLKETENRIDNLEALAGARERIIATASRSVVFLMGAYGFTEPTTGRPLRYAVNAEGQPIFGTSGQPALTADGDGPVVEIFYTGTGFVATDDGRVVAVNSAIIPEFTGSNLGVPAAEAMRLLDAPE